MNTVVSTREDPQPLIADGNRSDASERASAETAKIWAESRKLEAEADEIRRRSAHGWVDLFARPVLTAIIAATVTGFAVWSFGLSAALDLNELTGEYQKALERKKHDIEKQLADVGTELDTQRLQVAQLLKSAETPQDRKFAEAAGERLTDNLQSSLATSSSPQPWYAVVASTYAVDDAKRIAVDLRSRQPGHTVEVFRATDGKGTPLFAITLGGEITKEDATKIVREARTKVISTDAFAWTTPRWKKVDL